MEISRLDLRKSIKKTLPIFAFVIVCVFLFLLLIYQHKILQAKIEDAYIAQEAKIFEIILFNKANIMFYFFSILLIFFTFLLSWQVYSKMSKDKLNLANMKTDFAIIASHELRTPVTSICLISERLLKESLPEVKRTVYLHQIKYLAEKLSMITSNILDIAKIEKGILPVDEKSIVNLNNLISTVSEQYNILLQTKRQRIELQLDKELPVIFAGKNDIIRILSNLIDNAVKASNYDAAIRIRTERLESKAVLVIHNEGNIISAVDQPKIFIPFYYNNKNGTGLGLPLVKILTQQNDGEITFTSDKVSGTTFKLIFPETQENNNEQTKTTNIVS